MNLRRAVSLAATAWLLGACSAAPPIWGIPVHWDVEDPMGAATGVQDGDCGTMSDVLIALPDMAAIDRMIDAAGGGTGMYAAGHLQLYFGSVEGAAKAFGATALFVGANGDAWMQTGRGTAQRLAPSTTPAGREVWFPASGANSGPCPPG